MRPINLKRYNQILVAVLGTGSALGAALLLGIIGLEFLREDREPRILLGDAGSDSDESLEQELIFCEPAIVPGSGLQLIPVAVRSLSESGDVRVQSSALVSYSGRKAYRGGALCQLPEYGRATNIFNVVVRSGSSRGPAESQRVLFGEPVQIVALRMPNEACGEGGGSLPCGMLHWLVRDRDTNSDGAIDEHDALVAFHSDLEATALHAVTPRDVSVVSFTWDPNRNAIFYGVRRDRSGEGSFDEDDLTDLLEIVVGQDSTATSVVDGEIRQVLEQRIR